MRIIATLLTCLISISSSALGEDTTSPFQKFKGFVLDTPLEKPYLLPVRPHATNIDTIENKTRLTKVWKDDANTVTGCIKTQPYSHRPIMQDVGQAMRIMANNTDHKVEKFTFQPHFSGLMGPKITLMRKDIERALITNSGSAAEIYHNATINMAQDKTSCYTGIKTEWDIDLNHRVDAYDSDKSPLVQSRLRLNNRLHFGRFFLGSLTTTTPIYDNYDRDPTLATLNRPDPVRQDAFGFARQGLNVERLMLSGFVTPKTDLYLSGHAGYLEEAFFGVGGEILYRPHRKTYAIGFESWHTKKRYPYLKAWSAIDDSQTHNSTLLNAWYDIPDHPITVGASAGQFLDGDLGGEIKTIYTPAQGWTIEAFARYSKENETSNQGQGDNMHGGFRLSMPLGQFKLVPENSRQTIDIAPIARDKAQRIDNAYPLYDLTNAWHAKNIYRHWNAIAE